MSAARPLTVLQLLPALRGGGVERGTLEIAGALVEAGHRSLVVSGGGPMAASLEHGGSEHLTLDIGRKTPWTLRHVAALRRIIREREVDLVHARSRLPAWLARFAMRGLPDRARPRFVTTVHGAYSVSRYSEVMLTGDRVIAVSDTIAEYVRRSYPRFDPGRLETIHRGVDAAAFPRGYQPSPEWRQQWRESHPELEGKLVLALVGRLTRLKGHADLLDLLERLVREEVPVHGLVVGGAEAGRRAGYASTIAQDAKRRGLPVTFTGHRADVREIMSMCGVVLSLSRQPESFGRSVLEALYLGRPVVGYDHGGVGEVLRAAYPGGAVPVGDVAAAADRVRALARDAAPVDVGDPFPLRRMLAREVALYERLVGGR